MPDPVEELTQAIRTKLLDSEDFEDIFDDRYYIYIVPDNWSYPYVTSFDVGMNPWLTLGNVNSGETCAYPFFSFGDSPKDLRDGSAVINDLLHLGSIDMPNYETVYCKRTMWDKPVSIEDDKSKYVQLIEFEIRIAKI